MQTLCVDVTPSQVDDAMRVMDNDGSGAIEFNEFVDWFYGVCQCSVRSSLCYRASIAALLCP